MSGWQKKQHWQTPAEDAAITMQSRRHPNRRFLVCLMVTGVLCHGLSVGHVFAQEAEKGAEPTEARTRENHPLSDAQSSRQTAAFTELTPAVRQSVDAGLAYLASIQKDDGSFGHSRYGPNVGITALGCIAFMAEGNLPGRGEYGYVVRNGLDFILNHATESGLIAAQTSHGPMYGHGFATLFLGEIYGQTQDPRVREALLKAVKLIVNTQNDQGGWRYHPIPRDADISVTICQIMALRSARNSGISVPKKTIDQSIEYVRKCQNPEDGGFRYMIGHGGSAFPRTAAGVAALFYAGVYHGNAIQRGLKYILKNGRPDGQRSGGHFYYGQYYAMQAMYLAGGDYWRKWYPMIRQALIKRQQSDGHWESPHGAAYGTAMSLICLQVPNRLLPIFQR